MSAPLGAGSDMPVACHSAGGGGGSPIKRSERSLPLKGKAKEHRQRCENVHPLPRHFAEIRFGTFPRIPAGTANSRLPKNFKVKIFYFKIFNAHAAGRAGPKMTGYAGKKQGFIGDVFVR